MPDSLLDFLIGGLVQPGWVTLAVYLLVVTQLTIFSVTLYLHRSQAHRGVDFHPVLAHFFRFWAWLTTGMVTREWVAIHRKHHAKCETEEDPHSPLVYGISKVFWDGVELYREAPHERDDMEQYGRGTPGRLDRAQALHAARDWGPTLMLFISFALFGVIGVALWAMQMLWIPFWAAGVVNGLGHWWGYRNFETDDTSTNLCAVGLLDRRRGAAQQPPRVPTSSAKFALRKWEFDIGWAVIRGAQALGLAKVLRVAPALDVRPNIPVPDMDTMKALLAHRFQAMTDFKRRVLAPALQEEAAARGTRMRRLLPRKLRHGLADDGRWLQPEARAQMQAWVEQSPRIRALVEARARLAQVLTARSNDAAERLHQLQAWCHEAEASGIRALQDYAARLKGYSLQATRA